jgi:subtilisin family serine protease
LPDEYWLPLFQIDRTWQITKGDGVTVAVLDSGVHATADMRGRLLPGTDLIDPGGDGTKDPGDATQRNYSHGTNMAMLVASTGSGTGFLGVAPAAKILPVRVLGPGATVTGDSLDIAARGIRWAVDHRAKVISMSIGGLSPCHKPVLDAVKYAYEHDVIVVAAAGNAGRGSVDFPANCPGALAVGSADASDFARSSFSNYGRDLDFVAPGNDHPIPMPDGTILPGSLHNHGTSESAALVAGCLALLRAHFPKESARQIVTRALWHVHNGLGGKVFAKRIDDERGYGQILPHFALTQNTPPNAANPIYDEANKAFGAGSGGTTQPSGVGDGGGSKPSASFNKSNAPALAVVGVAVLGVIATGGLLLARRSRRPQPNR